MTNRIKTSAVALVATMTLAGCDSLLDVNNPNNLVEESIRQESAANAVVNGALSLTAQAVGQMWPNVLIASDEFFWIGSRDAWLSLDQGFLSDINNEMVDGAFPQVGAARWMADEAIEILEEHVAEKPASAAFRKDLARANFFSGIMYMIIGETQEDFAFSDKTEAGAPVGPSQMFTVLDGAISRFDKAVSLAQDLGESDLLLNATAMRARAKHSRAVWDKIKPSPKLSDPLVASTGAKADALAAIAMAGGDAADWSYSFTYSNGTVGNAMANWVNDRKENQLDRSLVELNAANDVVGIALRDPIDDIPDPALTRIVNRWKGGSYLDPGSQYAPLDIVSTRMLHLIVAEAALAGGDMATFTTHINHVRVRDGLTPYSGQIPAMDMLKAARRANTTLMGVRLADMYRFGIVDPKWEPQGETRSAPGTLLPITSVEVRANCHLNGLGCK